MTFQPDKEKIKWKVHFLSPIEKVYDALSTDSGRKTFWAEETKENDGYIEFTFLNYPVQTAKILKNEAPDLFSIEYFETEVTFNLKKTSDGGTDLSLNVHVEDEMERQEMIPGWVSVLMAMKAAVDYGVDLRNHNQSRTWQEGYVNN